LIPFSLPDLIHPRLQILLCIRKKHPELSKDFDGDNLHEGIVVPMWDNANIIYTNTAADSGKDVIYRISLNC
jgi:hypothetical protein